MAEEKKLKFIDFIDIYLRSFFIQTVWNFKGMVSLGLCYALIPVAKRLYNTKEDLKAFLQRYLSFFNTHPYFSSFALGSLAALEENYANGRLDDPEQIVKFRNAIIGPLGLVGDQLFWAGIKPASILAGIAGLIVTDSLSIKLIYLALFLILYNAPHLYIRYMGLKEGYKQSFGVYKILKIEHFNFLLNPYKIIGGSALGFVIGYMLISSAAQHTSYLAVFLISLLSAAYLRQSKQMVYLPIVVPIVISLIIGFFFKGL
ncbi:MAG TPA: hypothetical protein ENK44_17155 [Caldithrix abyssi]|uniref:PTS system mannose/fructose/sorbose family transporter subunit IID n=1 Tax=Caldithrix abyssi TaxID=187145 RepID=A0A7V4WWI4_CALAY|nr:hypothetical protein [Caldithrix abyssi]